MVRRVASVNGPIGTAMLVLALAASLAACGCSEQKADRLYRQAAERVERDDLAGAVDLYQRIVSEHPGTRAADRARADLVLYRGLLEASQRFPVRRAADLVVQVARAVERCRQERGAVPRSLAALVPVYLSAEPQDPWGRALSYRAIPGGGYVLSCFGSDGVPGGEGPAGDLVVADGQFVRGGAEVGR